MPWFDVSPSYRQKSFDFPRDEKVLQKLVVDFVGDLSLPLLEGKVPNAHEPNID